MQNAQNIALHLLEYVTNYQTILIFVKGFDVAKGRFDQSAHQLPRPIIPNLPTGRPEGAPKIPRYSGKEIQPFIRTIRFLWHDIQVLIRGPAAQHLNLHFEQRWSYSISRNTPQTLKTRT